jgi:hypothetical protein
MASTITLLLLAFQTMLADGVTGDILFTTIGASSTDTYTVILELVKEYA